MHTPSTTRLTKSEQRTATHERTQALLGLAGALGRAGATTAQLTTASRAVHNADTDTIVRLARAVTAGRVSA